MNNQEQIDDWNGEVGDKWAEHADQLDHLLEPFVPLILDAADLHHGEAIIDIGCGAGSLSLQAAQAIGADPLVYGVDVSAQLLKVARKRARQKGVDIEFIEDDASLFRSRKPVDVVISRFGVMFFDQPVEAFATIKSNLCSGGRMVFSCWQNLGENEWASAPGQIAKQFVSVPLPKPDPLSPGPFCFANKDRVVSLLSEAGWENVNIQEWSGKLKLPGKTLDESASFILELGPIARIFKEQAIPLEDVKEQLNDMLSSRLSDEGVPSLNGKAWIVSATAP